MPQNAEGTKASDEIVALHLALLCTWLSCVHSIDILSAVEKRRYAATADGSLMAKAFAIHMLIIILSVVGDISTLHKPCTKARPKLTKESVNHK